MNEPQSFYFSVLAMFLLLGINALFAALEFAVLRSSPDPFEDPETRTKATSKASRWLLKRIDISLAAAQSGKSAATLLLGWTSVHLAVGIRAEQVITDGPPWLPIATTIAVIGAAILAHLALGELAAKSVALRSPEQTLRLLSVPMVLYAQTIRPLLYLGLGTANLVLKLFGTSVPDTAERIHSVSDISRIVTQGTEHGVFDEDEENMLRGVFGFSETVAREVMTPRTDLRAINLTAKLSEIIAAVEETGFSRFPVAGNGIDDIHGIVLVKDLLSFIATEKEHAEERFHVTKVMRQAYFIPGTKPIDDLLNEFKSRTLHMAIVLDEHGGVDGLVTLEDLLEEIVGDIFDESDVAEHDLVQEENGDVLADGGVLVADLNSRYDLGIAEGDYDTIAGFIFTSLGRMPEDGEELTLLHSGAVRFLGEDTEAMNFGSEGLEAQANGRAHTQDTSEVEEEAAKLLIIIEKVENHRIGTVRLRQIATAEEAETGSHDPASQS